MHAAIGGQMTRIPFNTPESWEEANAALTHVLGRNGDALGRVRRLARELRVQLTSLFPLMESLCARTCPVCPDPCCRRACVWIDFRDLLFLHLAEVSVPHGQLLGARGERCRFGGPDGCRLARIQRPFICIWYLCPAQTGCLRAEPKKMARATTVLQRIKGLRQEMEAAFIRAVA